MTTRPTIGATRADGYIVTGADWNNDVVQQGNWAQELIAGTNGDKIPATAIAGSVGYYPNILVNGGMEVSQRNGTSLVNATTTATTTLDRWVAQMIAPTTAVSVQQVTAVDTGSHFGAAVNYNHVAGGGFLFYQTVENWQEFKGKVLYATARVQANTTGMFMYIADGLTTGLSARPVAGSSIQTLTATLLISASATLVHVTFNFDASCFATIDNVMLTLSSSPIDYVQRPNSEELLLCRRYWQRLKTSTRWRSASTSEFRDTPINFPVGMPGTPTAVLAAGTRTNIGSAAINSLDADSCRVEYIASASITDTSALLDTVTLEYNP